MAVIARRLFVCLACVAFSVALAPNRLCAELPNTEGDQPDRTDDPPALAEQKQVAMGDRESAPNAPPQSSNGASAVKNELARQAANPAAPLTQLQFRDIVLPNVSDTDGITNLFQIQPVIPIGPFDWFHRQQIIRFTFQVPTLPAPVNASGFGDLDLFDLITFKTSWGHLGVGPILVFPTAASDALGAGKYQAGPAVAVIYAHGNVTAGAILQNPISFAGDPDRPAVDQLIVAPTLTISLSKGWFAGLSDFNWTFDWTDNGAALVPLGMQVGKIVTLGKQPVNLSFEIGRMAARPAGTPDPGWIVGFELSPLFNWHLGPGKKITLRGKTAG